MSIEKRRNVQVDGTGPTTLVPAHGFGCNQNIWQYLRPLFAGQYRIVTFDLVGSGDSDGAAYSRTKYDAMIGMLAAIGAPQRFAAQVMPGPSPCYVNEGGPFP